jgi:hypothetical protein
MPGSDGRTQEAIRREIEVERRELAHAVGELREGLGKAADVGGRLEAHLPAAAASAFAVGFFLAGGMGATMRLFTRRGREGREKARFGRLTLVDHG